jgi:hypothetical protein
LIVFNWDHSPFSVDGKVVHCSECNNSSEALLSGVMASGFLGTDHCCGYRGVSKSFKGAFAPRSELQDLRGYALAGFVGSQLLGEALARPVESDFHIGNGSFVKVIGNHFQCPPAILLQDFCSKIPGLSVR